MPGYVGRLEKQHEWIRKIRFLGIIKHGFHLKLPKYVDWGGESGQWVCPTFFKPHPLLTEATIFLLTFQVRNLYH